MNKKPKEIHLLFLYDFMTSFVKKDILILEKNYNLSTYHFKFNNKAGVFIAYVKLFFFLLKHRNKFSLFVSQFAGHVSLLPSILGRLFKVKSLILVAGSDAACFPKIKYGNKQKIFQKTATSLSFKYCNYISPCHESLIEQPYDYDDFGDHKQGFHVFYPSSRNKLVKSIPYGFDSNFFKRDFNEPRQKNSFITIGNLKVKTLFVRKGYDLIIELGRRMPNIQITLVGAPEGYVIDNLPPNIKLLPYLSQPEIIQLFSQHQFYFQLSLMEGFPNALCEAMLCECIPIGSNVSGIPEIIDNTGYLLKKRNIELLTQLIQEAIDNPALEELGKNARKRISDNFTNERRERELCELINSIIGTI